MKYRVDRFIQESEFNTSFQKLSEDGKNSLSCQIIKNYYTIAYKNLISISSALTKVRDLNGQAVGIDPRELKPSSYRIEFELLALISSNLTQMPSLEKIIKDDKQTTNEDKLVLLGAYENFKNKIDGLFKLFDWPCFAIKEEKKD